MFQSASGILDNAFSRLSGKFGQSQRPIVTAQTFHRLQETIPGKIDVSKVPPYQKQGLCHVQAVDIMSARIAEASQAAPAPSSSRSWGSLWDQVKKAIGGDIKVERLPANAEELLAKFEDKGILTLRGPGLDKNYDDHMVVIFSVSKINVPGKGPTIVVGAIDCNDKANDPETTASRETAARIGKSHPSELTHEEANKNGAHLRRIRFMDGDSLVKHVRDTAMNHLGLIDDGKMLPPQIMLPRQRIPALTSDESLKLSQILTEIYDTPEVEKFEHRNAGRPEQDAGARRRMGNAMAQRLYKEAVKND